MNRRLMVAAACYADARGAIDIAERVVDLAGFDLIGYLMEDLAARDTAVSPRQRIVTTSGALVEAPDARRLKLMLASDARAFETHISRVARTHALTCRFERSSEDLFEGAIRLARGGDILLIGHRRLLHGRHPPVVVISGGTSAEAGSEGIAQSLAQGLHAPTITLKADADDTAILTRVQRLDAALIVAEARGAFRSAAHLRRLIDAARCPVLIDCPADFRSLSG